MDHTFRREQAPPAWLPRDHQGVIGVVDAGSEIIPYDEHYPGILMGGNAVIRRSAILKVGLYLTSLGRTGERLLAGEDEDMYRRLLASGAKGLYLPQLKIYHLIPATRLTKNTIGSGPSGVVFRVAYLIVLNHKTFHTCVVPRYLLVTQAEACCDGPLRT